MLHNHNSSKLEGGVIGLASERSRGKQAHG